jgi:signal transduction histidine kinase
MTTNDTASAIPDNAAAAPSRAVVRSTMWDLKAGAHEWWRLAARPYVVAFGFLLLAIISAASIFLVVTSQSDAELVAHTLQVENKLSALQALARNAESGQRGYLLTGDPNYLDIYRIAADAYMPAIGDLKTATADNPTQQQALAALEPIMVQKFDELRGTIRLYERGDGAAALALLRGGSGRALMKNIRETTDRMTEEEERLLKLRLSKSSRTNFWLLLANLTGTAFMIGLAIISLLTVRRMAENALRDSEKRGSELQAAVNELEAFSYSVSHDLRAPLRAIDAFSRILLKQHALELVPEAREHLQSVRDNTVQMGHLVDDLLAFSRLGRKPLSKKQISTATIVEQVLHQVRGQAEGRCVKVSVGDLPPLCGDAALLKQVFVNLIDNAFKYTRLRDDATVEIGSRNTVGEQVFFVRDNGVGFDMQYIGKLFGVFQRLHRAEDFEGTGVGLAIVQRIINRHGGRIWAEAEVGRGAAFYFTMEAPRHA